MKSFKIPRKKTAQNVYNDRRDAERTEHHQHVDDVRRFHVISRMVCNCIEEYCMPIPETFPDLWLTYVTMHFVDKVSAMSSTRPTQPSIPSGSAMSSRLIHVITWIKGAGDH